MNLFKHFIFLSLTITSLNANAAKICISGHIFRDFNSYGESFENAVKLAISESKFKADYKKYFYKKEPLSSITAYKKMLSDKCSGIIGYSYLSDLLTLNNAMSLDKNIPILTPYATAYTKKLQQNIFLMRPTQKYFATESVKFIKKNLKDINQIVVVTDLRRVEMLEYKSAYKQLLADSKTPVTYIDTIKDDLNQDKLDYGNKTLFIILSGTNLAVKVITKTQYKAHYWGTETFGSKSSQSLMNLLDKSKAKNIYSARNLAFDNKTKKRNAFYESYMNKFNVRPTMLSLYAYDATKIILNLKYSQKEKYRGITGVTFNNQSVLPSDFYSIIMPSQDYKVIESNLK